MNNVINVDTWEECHAKIQDIKREHPKTASKLLFRGQSDSEWKLATTLERRSSQTFNFIDYYRLALRIRPEIETESGLRVRPKTLIWNCSVFSALVGSRQV